MKYSLLDMVQIILSSIDGDEVNSISDTIESDQIVKLIRQVYYDMSVDLELPEHNTIFQLTASGSASKPTVMTLPEDVSKLETIQYDNKASVDTYTDYKPVLYKPFELFIQDQQALREDTVGIGKMDVVFDGDTFEFIYRTDKHPQFYTTMDDNKLIFDSFDSTIDTTLQKSKTLCSGVKYPEFLLQDSFIPDLDPPQFSLLVNKAKELAFVEIKQSRHPIAEREARRQRIVVQKRKDSIATIKAIDKAPKYGR